jgi:hypothetical protein
MRVAVTRILGQLGRSLPVIVACASVLVPGGPARAADSADDVCASTANPCQITSEVTVDDGAILDFGIRTVRLSSGGQLDVGSGSATVRCGTFDALASTTKPRLKVKSGGQGGSITIVARRGCSANPSLWCTDDATCAAASAGTCSAGSGNITLAGNVHGEGDPAADVSFVAAGSFTSTGNIILRRAVGTSPTGHGGTLEIAARTGNVQIQNTIDLSGGSEAYGGRLTVDAGGTLSVTALIDATGGNDGGGSIDLRAEDDLNVQADLRVDSTSGEGVGGDISLDAGGDLTVTGSAAAQTLLDAEGHASGGEASQGGEISLTAAGHLTLNDHVRLRANAPNLEEGSTGGHIEIAACQVDILAGANVEARGEEGGTVEMRGFESIFVDQASSVDATGAFDDGEIALVTGALGHCVNNPAIGCTANSDCTVGCTSYECLENPDTEGTFAQFDPPPEVREEPSLRPCGE